MNGCLIEKAQKALDDFTEYLRGNLSSLTETKLISFEDELKHIKTYVSLEKMRFGDRVDICYNIQTTDFSVPTLSLLKQMLYFDFWYKISL